MGWGENAAEAGIGGLHTIAHDTPCVRHTSPLTQLHADEELHTEDDAAQPTGSSDGKQRYISWFYV
jgi:hypothetical protein